MQAVCGRAYMAALSILEAAIKIWDMSQSQAGSGDPSASATAASMSARSAPSSTTSGASAAAGQQILMSMLYPPGSSLDNSPLHVLCANDTCSFTWTGADHINQVGCYKVECLTKRLRWPCNTGCFHIAVIFM